jgi:hypothetical protein
MPSEGFGLKRFEAEKPGSISVPCLLPSVGAVPKTGFG